MAPPRKHDNEVLTNSISVRLQQHVVSDLRALAKKEGTTLSEQLSKAVTSYLRGAKYGS